MGKIQPHNLAQFVLTLPTSQFTYSHFAYSHFAYKCVSFRLHMGIRIYMTYKRFQVQDLLWSTTLDDLVGTREFRGQDWLEEAYLLISTDSSIRDVLLTENVKDQWQQKMVYYWEKMPCTHTLLLAKCKLRWMEGCKRFGYVGKVTQKCRQRETYTPK